jgi:hypothetical protein
LEDISLSPYLVYLYGTILLIYASHIQPDEVSASSSNLEDSLEFFHSEVRFLD